MQIENSEFQDQLVRGLAHRMNNILTLFHGYVGLLLDNKGLDPATQQGLTKIKEGARAATELMDRTHSVVRPPSVVLREIDLGELLRLMRPGFEQLRSPGTTMELHCPPGLPPLWADLNRVKTAIWELVRNACEATAEGGGTVRIAVSATQPAMSGSSAGPAIAWISISVTDDGPGIPPELIERVFVPFFTLKKKQNAAGLGLTVALGFAQRLGGRIRVESSPGRTCVEMILPSERKPG